MLLQHALLWPECQVQHWEEAATTSSAEGFEEAAPSSIMPTRARVTVTHAGGGVRDGTKADLLHLHAAPLENEGRTRMCACRGTAGFAHGRACEQAKISSAEAAGE